MSDFDNFEQQQTEEDPAAEFLAREQDVMAELEGENFTGSEPAPDAAPQTQETNFQEPEVTTESDNIFDPLSEPTDVDVPQMPSEHEFPPLEGPYGQTQPVAEDSAFSTPPPEAKPRIEPEKIRKWREEQKVMLEAKDAEAEKKKAEWREVAKKELEDWYKHLEDQLEKARANNRESEVVFIQERDESIPGHEWERICRLCEFNPKAARNTKDISRMRSILLQLKQTPIVR